jgi:uncharacterized protein YdcH (DUF465 family)
VREQKLRVEVMQAKRENAAFAQLVEKKKQFEHIVRKVRVGPCSSIRREWQAC